MRKTDHPKARRKSPERGCVRSTSRSTSPRQSASGLSVSSRRSAIAAVGRSDTAALRQEFRAWQASLPTALERDTLLTPEWIAESVVQEVERFLKADLPEGFSERLAAKAHYLYPRHKHFHKGMNRPGNRGRENLLMFMRHWTAGWLKRERNPLHKKLPYSFGMGRRLPVVPPMFQTGGELIM
jgi:hypothetical protein